MTVKLGKLSFGRLTVFKSLDPSAIPEDWVPVSHVDVPDGIKDPVTMGRIKRGEVAQVRGQSYHYRAEVSVESR
jgi:hypothetical protein